MVSKVSNKKLCCCWNMRTKQTWKTRQKKTTVDSVDLAWLPALDVLGNRLVGPGAPKSSRRATRWPSWFCGENTIRINKISKLIQIWNMKSYDICNIHICKHIICTVYFVSNFGAFFFLAVLFPRVFRGSRDPWMPSAWRLFRGPVKVSGSIGFYDILTWRFNNLVVLPLGFISWNQKVFFLIGWNNLEILKNRSSSVSS